MVISRHFFVDFVYVWIEFKNYMEEPQKKFLHPSAEKGRRSIKTRHGR